MRESDGSISVVRGELHLAQLGQRSSHFHARGPAADDDDRQVAFLRPMGGGSIYLRQDHVAHRDGVFHRVDRLGVLLCPRHTEVGRPGAGRQHEIVVGEGWPFLKHDSVADEVDGFGLVLAKAQMGVGARICPHGVGDVARVQTRGRHLVEQRLEGVVVVVVDENEVDVCFRQRLTDAKPTETRPDHDHTRTMAHVAPSALASVSTRFKA